MKQALHSLRFFGIALALTAFVCGLASAVLWMQSAAAWERHLTRSYYTGKALFATLTAGGNPPAGVEITPLSPADQALAAEAAFSRISGTPRPALVTNVTIQQAASAQQPAHTLSLAVVAAELRYPLAKISFRDDTGAADTLGALTRIMASHCSDPVMFASVDTQPWQRIDGTAVWGCAAAPSDYRLIAVLLAVVSLGVMVTVFLDMTSHFDRFAALLRSRRRLGGPDSYETSGPRELRAIVAAVNNYLETGREQLEKRAMVLSGVSHDLGTPATRLRLRAALIDDPDLRQRLERDIDQMTGIIDSVLTYTRTELDSEEPRQISLTSLVEALVADYSDTGQPVTFRPSGAQKVQGGRSVFMLRRGQGTLPEERRVVVTARPVALQRALSNLIDNALKYGRRATVELEADADTATLIVEDEGADYLPEDLEKLVAPYRRGTNTDSVQGFGLGLTIVASIASMHGGTLSFEAGATGIRARLSIERN